MNDVKKNMNILQREKERRSNAREAVAKNVEEITTTMTTGGNQCTIEAFDRHFLPFFAMFFAGQHNIPKRVLGEWLSKYALAETNHVEVINPDGSVAFKIPPIVLPVNFIGAGQQIRRTAENTNGLDEIRKVIADNALEDAMSNIGKGLVSARREFLNTHFGDDIRTVVKRFVVKVEGDKSEPVKTPIVPETTLEFEEEDDNDGY